jgi:hypothetical protein
MAQTYAGNQEWIWTANFEAFDAYPAGIGSTPVGDYRFVVEGLIRKDLTDTEYELTSEPFHVGAWNGLTVDDLRVEPDGSVSFSAGGTYPVIDDNAAFPYVKQHMRNEADRGELVPADIISWCDTCSFRSWVRGEAEIVQAIVTVIRTDGSFELITATRGEDGRFYAATALSEGDVASVWPGAITDTYGETNSDGASIGTNPTL